MSFDLAARHPERVKKLVLNGCPGWTREEGRRYHEDDWLLRQSTEQGLMPHRTLERIKGVITNADRRVVDLWDKGHVDKSWLLICHVALTEYDVPSRVRQVQAPTLLLYGEKETGHLLEGKETLLSGIHDVLAENIANAGILPPYEEPDAFSKLVLGFLGT